MKEITVQELETLRKNKTPHVLLDVRESDELAISKIDGAVHMPMGDVTSRVSELPTDQPLVVMCRSGRRSGQITALLNQFGFDAANLSGGILEWGRVIDPSIKSY